MGLLKGIDPLLTADLLHILRSMGHGDKIVICDCNFPASTISTYTANKKHIVITASLPETLNAICSVLPLDRFVEYPISHMCPERNELMPPDGTEVLLESFDIISGHSIGFEMKQMKPIQRFQFYEQAKNCYAVVQTMERRPYANFILTKGVIGPHGQEMAPITEK